MVKTLNMKPEELSMKQEDEHDFRDPVCGMTVSQMTAADELIYDDKIFYFCAKVCRETFEANPEKYIPHHRQHGMKPN